MMPVTDKDKWNAKYQANKEPPAAEDLKPSYSLHQFQHLLPRKGQALDLASGYGANALFLAQHNLQTHAWDISSIAIDRLTASARSLNLQIHTQVRDVVIEPPEPDFYDVIVVSHFLDRQIMPAIIGALRKEGLLFYQTFTRDRVQNTGPGNEAYRLGRNELLDLCQGLRIIVYREEGLIGDTDAGFRNEALLIGQRI